jgi:hypothetical protein
MGGISVAFVNRQWRKRNLSVAIFLILSSGSAAFGAQLVTDEASKIEILKAAFPQAKVSVSQQKPLDWKPDPWPDNDLTDALAGEEEYEVVKSADKFEQAWTTEMADVPYMEHSERRVRIRAYKLRSEAQQYVVLAHYQFVGIQDHVDCCEWFARLFVLSRKNGLWTMHHTDASLMYRAKTVRSFRLVDLYGDGREEIVVEAEKAEATYRTRVTMSIFRITNDQLLQLASVDTLGTNNAVHTQYSRELDLTKTRQSAGRAFYFKTIVYGTEEEQFPTPRIEEKIVKPSR